MNRRLSFSDEEAIPPPEQEVQQALDRATTAPPVYSKIRPGSRDEFVRDLNAYQAACFIHKAIDGVPNDPPADVPPYDTMELSNTSSRRSVGETEVFRIQFLDALTKIHDYMHTKRGLSDAVVFVIFALALGLIIGGGAAGAVLMTTLTLIALIVIVFLITFGQFLYTTYRYYCKRQFLKAIDIAIAKVGKFERLDEKTVNNIKRGILQVVPNIYWPTQGAKASRPPRYDEVITEEQRETSS